MTQQKIFFFRFFFGFFCPLTLFFRIEKLRIITSEVVVVVSWLIYSTPSLALGLLDEEEEISILVRIGKDVVLLVPSASVVVATTTSGLEMELDSEFPIRVPTATCPFFSSGGAVLDLSPERGKIA